MVGYDDTNNALTLGDDDSLRVGDYELKYNSTDDEWHAEYGRPIGGELGRHGDTFGPEYDAISQFGEYSLNFDGANDFIDVDNIDSPVIPETSNFTIFGRFNSDSVSLNELVFAQYIGQTDNGRILLRISDTNPNTFQVFLGGDGTLSSETLSSTTSITANTWYNFALTRNGDTFELFINGTSEDTLSEGSTRQILQTANLVGAYSDTPTDYRGDRVAHFDGNIDDIRFYDRVLSDSEISDLSSGTDIQTGLQFHYDFEFPETPNVAIDSTGDTYPQNAVPRSTSGSLVPQGLAESVSAGEALADDGNTYSSVQTAVDNASGWVFVGPGTFNESITISTAGLTLEGCGYDTFIDGGSSVAVQTGADNCTITNIRVSSNSGSGANALYTNGNNTTFDNCIVTESGSNGISTDSSKSQQTIVNCRVSNTDSYTIFLNSPNCSVIGNNLKGDGIGVFSDDHIIANNIIDMNNGGNWGVNFDANSDTNDTIVISNRIIEASDHGIVLDGVATDNIIANNRVSDSGTSDIEDAGTGTVLDGNKTGASN